MEIKNTVYLDYNATTPIDPKVLEEMLKILREDFGNPSSQSHIFGQRAAEYIENARRRPQVLSEVLLLKLFLPPGQQKAAIQQFMA